MSLFAESESDFGIYKVQDAPVGTYYSYYTPNNLAIPYGTILGMLSYKRFREPVINDPTRYVGVYVCKFSNYNGEFEADELIKKM